MDDPNPILLAGPNGAGKSTAAPDLLRGAFHVDGFVNADVPVEEALDQAFYRAVLLHREANVPMTFCDKAGKAPISRTPTKSPFPKIRRPRAIPLLALLC
jgi:hypothetical protein